jgi:hypothetical protein
MLLWIPTMEPNFGICIFQSIGKLEVVSTHIITVIIIHYLRHH